MDSKAILLYLEKNVKDFKVNKRGAVTLFTCPYCNKHEAARFVPGTAKINCMACHNTGDLHDIACYLGDITHTETKETLMDRIYEELDLTSNKKIKEALDFYVASGWNLTPITKRTKRAFEIDWVNKEHRDQSEWLTWLEQGMNIGVKCGNTSSITIVDIDQAEIPSDIDLLKGTPLIQKTARGWHLIYKYVNLPSTKIAEYKVDLLNDGRQAVIFPSIVEDEETKVVTSREFIEPLALTDMPEDLYKLLKSKIEEVSTPAEEDKQEDVIFDETTPLNLIDKGGRHNSILQLGGILSKQLNQQDLEFAVSVLNNKLCVPPLPQRELRALIKGLEKYVKKDEKALAVQIFKYLNIVEFANSKEIRDALGYPKEDIDKALAWLVMEKQLIKRGRTFSIIKRANWKQELSVNYNAVPFEVPFFGKHVNIAWGDMILLASKTKAGKTTIAINFIKYLKDQGIKNIYYIGSEAGSRFTKTAGALGLSEGDFKWDFIVDPTKITLEPNAVTILDWLMIPDKCIDGESLVVTEKGLHKIKDLVNKTDTTLITNLGNLVPKECFELKTQEVYDIELNDGSTITGTKVHPLLTRKGFVQLQNLKQEDKIVCLKNTSSKCTGDNFIDVSAFNNLHVKKDKYDYFLDKIPNEMTKDLAYLIGLLVGDGSYTTMDHTGLCFGKQSRGLFQNAARIFQKVYGNTYYRKRFNKRKQMWGLGFPKKVREHLLLCGMQPSNALTKEIPSGILKASPEVQTSFIRGLLETDGFIGKSGTMGFTFASETLIKQLQLLFFHLGIESQIRKKYNKKYKKNYYNLSIKNKVDMYKMYYTWWRHCKSPEFTYMRKYLRKYFSNRKNTEKYLTSDKNNLIEVEKSIISITKRIVSDYAVYDFEVPEYHIFTANGMINHNSQTDAVFKHFADQLYETKGLLIAFQQLKQNDTYFAENMAMQYPALSARYIYTSEDGTKGQWKIDAVREPKLHCKTGLIPCTYDVSTRILKADDA